MKDKIMGGYVILARQIFESEIWLDKPSSWKIIWIYIFGQVNHKDNGKFKRGEGYFNFKREIKNIGCDITYDMIRHSLRFFKDNEMISTSRSTRGMIIKVLKFDKYQDANNYSSTNTSTSKAQEKHIKSTPINKNDKNDKNEKKPIAETSSAKSVVISDLLKDKNKHIQIIGLYSKLKNIDFTSIEHQKSFIKRNLRASVNLKPYPIEKIIETMKWLKENADFKITLETVGKFIDEDLNGLAGSNNDLINNILNK